MPTTGGPPEFSPAEFRLWDLVGLGGYVVACVVLGAGVGLLVDARFGVSPTGVVTGLGLGILVAVVGSCLRIARYFRR